MHYFFKAGWSIKGLFFLKDSPRYSPNDEVSQNNAKPIYLQLK